MADSIRLKRIQDPVAAGDGARILVDREHNQARVLREVLQQEIAEEQRPGESASPVCYRGDFEDSDNRG